MKVLKIKVTYDSDGERKIAETSVPYVLDKGYDLPKEYPFTKNVYFGPDSGAYLGYIYIQKDGNLHYLGDIVRLDSEKVHYSPFKNAMFVFDFEVVENEN